MQRNYEKNGLSLNPMALWQYVMKNKADRRVPRLVIFDMTQTEVEALGLDHPEVDYVAFDATPNGHFSKYDWILFRESSRISKKEYFNLLSSTDYFYSLDEVKRVEAALCGVKVFKSQKDLVKQIKCPKILSKVERIENWELAKTLLTG